MTYLITGSNKGIGLEFCRQLSHRGDNVIASCRDSSNDLRKLAVRVEENVDVSSGDSVIKLKKKIGDEKIKVLIHNAGIMRGSSLLDLDPDNILKQFKVNSLSPLCFTKAFLSNLVEGSKIILITSRMGSIQDNTSGGSYGYRMSKAALCMAGKSLSIDLHSKKISVGIIHPGLVSTSMTGFTSSGISPEESVNGMISIIDSLNLENSGTFWHSNGNILPW